MISGVLAQGVFHAAGTCWALGVPCPLCAKAIEHKARKIVQDAVSAVYAEEREHREFVDLGGEA